MKQRAIDNLHSKGRFFGESPVQPGRGLSQVRVIVPKVRSIFLERPECGSTCRTDTFRAGSSGLSQMARFRQASESSRSRKAGSLPSSHRERQFKPFPDRNAGIFRRF